MTEDDERTPGERLDAALMPMTLRTAIDAANRGFDLEDPDEVAVMPEWEAAARTDADYCARLVVRFDRDMRAREADAEALYAQIGEWLAGELAPLQRRRAWYEARLEQFHRAELEKDPRHAKTVRLPSGTELRSLAGKVTVEIADTAKLLEWLETNEYTAAINYKDPTIDKRQMTRMFGMKVPDVNDEGGEMPAVDTTSGEAVPGVTFRRGYRTFTINLPGMPEPAATDD